MQVLPSQLELFIPFKCAGVSAELGPFEIKKKSYFMWMLIGHLNNNGDGPTGSRRKARG